jgi:hypothetical protein
VPQTEVPLDDGKQRPEAQARDDVQEEQDAQEGEESHRYWPTNAGWSVYLLRGLNARLLWNTHVGYARWGDRLVHPTNAPIHLTENLVPRCERGGIWTPSRASLSPPTTL